jgi:signal peptidase I
MADQSPEMIPLALGEEVLRASGEMRFVAQGSSMVPSIFPGDVLVVRREAVGKISRNDIVLFSRGGRWFAHRVIYIANEGTRSSFITRGDALPADDPPVAEHEFLGQVAALDRGRRGVTLTGPEAAWSKFLRWAVRKSDSVTLVLLHWNSLRMRFAGSPRKDLPDVPEKVTETFQSPGKGPASADFRTFSIIDILRRPWNFTHNC